MGVFLKLTIVLILGVVCEAKPDGEGYEPPKFHEFERYQPLKDDGPPEYQPPMYHQGYQPPMYQTPSTPAPVSPTSMCFPKNITEIYVSRRPHDSAITMRLLNAVTYEDAGRAHVLRRSVLDR
eukprot:959437_1